MEYGSLSFLERVHTGAASGTQGKVGDGESHRWPGVCLVAFGRVAKGQQDGTRHPELRAKAPEEVV